MKQSSFLAGAIVALTLVLNVGAQAQSSSAPSKIEVGVQFSSITIVQQWPYTGSATGGSENSEAGFGGRITFNLNPNFALEAEGNFFPHENFNEPAAGGRKVYSASKPASALVSLASLPRRGRDLRT